MMIKEYMYHPSRQSLEYGRAESKRYGLSMPPHMIRGILFTCVRTVFHLRFSI